MPTPSEEIVRRVLSINGREAACRRAVDDAWATVQQKYPERAWWRRKSTRAHLIWEHSVNNAIDAFDVDSGVHVVQHHDTASFIMDDTVLLRFKKADIQLKTRNYPTLLAKLFHRHENDLFGHEGHHRVEVAHIFNRFETDLDWIGVVARDNKNVLWNFELGAGSAIVERLPLPDTLAPAATRIVRQKSSDDNQNEQENE